MRGRWLGWAGGGKENNEKKLGIEPLPDRQPPRRRRQLLLRRNRFQQRLDRSHDDRRHVAADPGQFLRPEPAQACDRHAVDVARRGDLRGVEVGVRVEPLVQLGAELGDLHPDPVGLRTACAPGTTRVTIGGCAAPAGCHLGSSAHAPGHGRRGSAALARAAPPAVETAAGRGATGSVARGPRLAWPAPLGRAGDTLRRERIGRGDDSNRRGQGCLP